MSVNQKTNMQKLLEGTPILEHREPITVRITSDERVLWEAIAKEWTGGNVSAAVRYAMQNFTRCVKKEDVHKVRKGK